MMLWQACGLLVLATLVCIAFAVFASFRHKRRERLYSELYYNRQDLISIMIAIRGSDDALSPSQWKFLEDWCRRSDKEWCKYHPKCPKDQARKCINLFLQLRSEEFSRLAER